VPGIPDDTNDPNDPDKNTNEVAAAMSSNTAAKASAAARAKKKTTAGSKTTGETAADYTTAPPANKPTKLYYLDSGDKYFVCYDLKGTTEYVILVFYLNGMLPPKGVYQCTLAEDGHTIRWSRPVNSFDNILQAMHRDKIEPDTTDSSGENPTRSTSRRTSREPPTAMTFRTGRRVSSPPWTNVIVRITNTTRW
jgi:hypothetical protein